MPAQCSSTATGRPKPRTDRASSRLTGGRQAGSTPPRDLRGCLLCGVQDGDLGGQQVRGCPAGVAGPGGDPVRSCPTCTACSVCRPRWVATSTIRRTWSADAALGGRAAATCTTTSARENVAEILTTAARSAAVSGRPSSAANRARVGSASARTCWVRFDHRVISSAGTPAISACPCALAGLKTTLSRWVSGAQRGLVEGAGGFLVVVDLVSVDGAPAAVGAVQACSPPGRGKAAADHPLARCGGRRLPAAKPAVEICSTPSTPFRDIPAWVSRKSSAARTAARCASVISVPTVPPPMAHSADTDLGAENVKS